MTKVSEMIGDFAHPAGEAGRSVPLEIAEECAAEIRQMINRDLEEPQIALNCYLYNCQVDQEEIIAAWDYLNAGERRAYKEYVRLGKYEDAAKR